MDGIKTFRTRNYDQDSDHMRKLVEEGQKPEVLLIGCSDSRVDPALLMQAKPGELFIVRNVANLVPPYQPDGNYHGTSAAMEYAIRVLKVRHVVVLGHAHCGGIQGLIRLRAGESLDGDFIAPWVSIAADAVDRYFDLSAPGTSEDDKLERRQSMMQRLMQHPFVVERAAIRQSIGNLMSFPWIREAVEAGTLQLHGWWFDLDTGDLWALDQDTKVFTPFE